MLKSEIGWLYDDCYERNKNISGWYVFLVRLLSEVFCSLYLGSAVVCGYKLRTQYACKSAVR